MLKTMAVLGMLLGWLVASPGWASTILPHAISDEEMKRLPAFCHARIKMPSRSPEYQGWRARIGTNFLDFFHYCAGLNYINRYWSARDERARSYYLRQAKSQLDYMVKAEKPDFAMRADLYANRGEVLKLMGDIGGAIRDFNVAIEAGPGNPRVYMQLADVYTRTKDAQRALATITQGLRANPDSQPLRRQYLQLGGKEPFPEAERKEPAAQAPAASMQASEEKTAPAEPAASATPAVDAGQPAARGPGGADAAAVEAAPSANRKNPWCRFCPDE